MPTTRPHFLLTPLLLVLATAAAAMPAPAQQPKPSAHIPALQTKAFDDRTLSFPHDLTAANILILGFTRHSEDTTTAWEKPLRARLAAVPVAGVSFYDMPVLAAVPGFLRGMVLSQVRKHIPDPVRPHFAPILDHEPEWKQAAAFDPHTEDAAYILLVDRTGQIRWQTHAAFTPALLDQLLAEAKDLAKGSL